MHLIFENKAVGYDYDQVLVRPRLSYIESRQDVDLSTEILPGITLKIPIIASPMTTVSESLMCIKMYRLGGLAILHRFNTVEYLEGQMRSIREHVPQSHAAFAVGIKEEDKIVLQTLAPLAGVVCVDVNIGHHIRTINMVKFIKDTYPHLRIIAGSVSTAEGAADLCEAGADCIRATNGGGSACTTITVTGVGIPTATSLYECVKGADQFGKTVIADGGHKGPSSMVKALALGADAVMIGGLLAGSSGCPEHVFFVDPDDGVFKAMYYGMASRAAQEVRGSGVKPGTTPEGISKTMSPKGKTRIIIDNLAGGIRSGLSFCNARNIQELRETAEFIIRY